MNNPTLRQIVDAANTMVDANTGLQYDTSNVAPESTTGDLGFKPLNKYDEGLKRGMNQENVRAFNQPNYKALGNSLAQLVTGTIGELVGSPGYAYEGMKSLTDAGSDFDNMFINAGKWISELGTENFPIYTDDVSRDTIFNPFDGEWVANSIAQFGPTVAMLAASFATDGLLYPALANKLSKLPAIGKYLGMAEEFIQGNNLAKSARMAFTSRAIEGGMEAYETYNSTLEELKRSGLSEEEAKLKAGEAASRVYSHNWYLAAMDLFEFNGLLSGFGKLGKFGRVLGGTAIQAVPEALEEGIQYAISQEAKSEVMGRADSTVFDEFIKGLGDTEMQQAMVQGALGGAVFSVVGKLANKLTQNYAKATTASPAEFQQLINSADLELIKRHANEGNLAVQKVDFKAILEDANRSEGEKKRAQDVLDKIDHYEALADSVEESDPDVKQAKVDSLFKEKFLTDQLNSDISTRPEQQKAELEEKKKATKSEELKAQYQKQLDALPEDVKASKLDPIAKKKAKEDAKLEEAILKEQQKQKELDTQEGKDKVKQDREQELADQRLAQVKGEIDSYKSPQDIINGKTKYNGNTDALNLIESKLNEEVQKELKDKKVPAFKNEEDLKEFYKDKPFATFKKFGTTEINIPKETTSSKPQVGQAFEYTNNKGVQKKVKLTNEVGDMYEFTDEKGKKFKKLKSEVDKNVGNKFNPTDQFEEAEVVDETPQPLTEEALEETPTVEEIIAEQVDNTNRVDELPTDDIELSEEESEHENEAPINNSNPAYVKVIDMALFKYSEKDGVGRGYITNHYGGDMSIEEIDAEYKIKNNLKPGTYYTLINKEGFPVPSAYLKDLGKDYDLNIIRNLYLYKNLPVSIEIDNNLPYNKGKDHTQVRMDVVIYPNGVRKIIGILSANSNDELQNIRKQIFDSKSNSGIYKHAYKTTIEEVGGGMINTHSDASKRQAPSTVLPEGVPLMLGVGYTIGDDESGAVNKTNFGSPAVNSTIKEFIASNDFSSIKPGNIGKHIYMYTRDSSGRIIPVRVFAKPVKAIPYLKQQLLQAINTFNEVAAREIIKFNYKNAKGEKKSTPHFDDKLASLYSDVLYEDKYLVDGAIFATRDENGNYTTIVRYDGKDKGWTVLNKDLSEKAKAKKDINPNGMYLHYAWNYYQFYEMDVRPLQIDHTKVNIGNYNELVDERLESDLIPGANFHSPRFKIDLNKLDQDSNYNNVDRSLGDFETSPENRVPYQEEYTSDAEIEAFINEDIIEVSDSKRIKKGIVEFKKGSEWVAYKDQTKGTAKSILDAQNKPESTKTEPTNSDNNSLDDLLGMYNVPDVKHREEVPETLEKPVETIISNVVNELTKEETNQLKEELNSENLNEELEKIVINDLNNKVIRKNNTLLNKIINKIKKLVLALLLSASFFITTSFNYNTNNTSIDYSNISIENFSDFNNIYRDQEIINKSDNINIINSFESGKENHYLIIDKANSLAHLYNDGNLLSTFEVGTGKIAGDEQTQTIVKNGKVLWDSGNQQTGAGIYTVGGIGKYKSSSSYTLKNERGISVPTVLHETLSNRKKLFADRSVENNRMSYGCVNFQAKDLKELSKYSKFGKESNVYILPDNNINKFVLVDGKLRFISDNPDVNRTITSYVPTEVKFTADNINKTTRDYLDALSKHKASLMKEYPTISNDIYNQLSKLAYGILGQESSFGTFGGPRGKLGFVKDELLSRTTNLDLSLGITQVRLSSINKSVRDKFQINERGLRDNSEISAIATMSVLLDIYINEIPTNKKADFTTLIPLAYSNRSEFKSALAGKEVKNIYVNNVNNYGNNLNVYIGLDNTVKHRTISLVKTFKLWDKQFETSWFESVFPGVDLKVLNVIEHIRQFGDVAYDIWGAFHNSGVSILNSAQAGTVYHEAYHVIHNMFLNEIELAGINAEARKRYGAPNQSSLESLRETNPNLNETDLIDLYYEEKLADDFMDYAYARELEYKNIENLPFWKRIGAKLRRFFRDLYDFIKFTIQNKTTIDKVFFQGYRGDLKRANLKRDVSSLTPKFRRNANYSPTQYQEILDFSTAILSDAIEEFNKANPKLDIKAIVNTNVIPKGKTNLSNLESNLIFSRSLPYSVVNKVLMQYQASSNKQDVGGEFTKLLNNLFNVNTSTGEVTIKQLTYDILKNLSTRGIIINVKENEVIDQEIGQPEDEDNTLNENEDSRESWQAKFASVSAFERLGQKLRFRFNNIPVLKWIDKVKGQYEAVSGYLGFTKTHSANYAYNQLQPIVGNSTSSADMISKLQESDNIIAKYVTDNWIQDEEFIGQLYIAVGQKNHPLFVSLLQEKINSKNIKTKAVSSNSNTLLNKIVENVTASFVSFSSLYNQDGTVNVDEAIKAKKDFDEFKANVIEELKKSKVLSDKTISNLFNLLTKYNINIPIDVLEQAKDNRKFFDVLKGNGSSIYNFIDNLAKGNDALEQNNSGIRDFIKPLRRYYANDVQSAHKNPSGGQVYEWIDANYLGRSIHQLKSGTHFIDFHQNDIYYKHSPLLNLIKNSHNGKVNPNEYFIDPAKIEYTLYSEIKLDGYNFAKEYSNMSEKELYLSILMGYYNSNNHDGTAIFPLPVHSDSPTMTGIKIPIIKNLTSKVKDDKIIEKGLLSYLNDAAYQEFIRVKLNRQGIKNQNKYENKFIYFDVLESKEFKVKKAKLLSLDFNNIEHQEEIREILKAVVYKQYTNAYNKEIQKLVKLNIISNVNGQYVFNDNLIDNKPVEPLMQHFVANFMLHQNQFGSIFNGDLSFYKDIGDYYKRAKQIWSPGTYLDTSKTRATYNVKYYKTNLIKKGDPGSSYDAIEKALNALYPKEIADKMLKAFEEIDETDAQSYIDLFRFKEQQRGLHRWSPAKEEAYQRLMRGESNMTDYNVIFNINKPFYYGKHLVDNQIIPVQNKNSEFIIIPAFAKKTHPLYNPEYTKILEDMGYEFDDTGNVLTNHEQIEQKRNVPNNTFVDQIAFDSAIKVGYKEGVHQYNNSDWRLQMETPAHHIDSDVIFATQVRKHMMNDLDLEATYTLPDGTKLNGKEWLSKYNERIIEDIKIAYDKVVKRFDNFTDLIDSLREEVIKRDLGDQYLQALEVFTNDIGELETKLPLWHPLHLYRVESLLNSLFTKQVSTQKLSSGVTLANLSSFGFNDKPTIKFKKDGSIDYMEAYVPIHDERFFQYVDENGILDPKVIEREFGAKVLRGIVWRIPNEDKYSTFNIKIKGFLPKESGGAIVLPAEVTKIAGLD